MHTESSVQIFLLKKYEELLHCKSSSYFFSAKIGSVRYLCTMPVLLTDHMVSFEQLGPELHHGEKSHCGNSYINESLAMLL